MNPALLRYVAYSGDIAYMSGIILHHAMASQFFGFARTQKGATYDENGCESKKLRGQGVRLFLTC